MSFARMRPALIPLVLIAGLSLAACGDSNSLPADQVISKASTAIKAANSFHFTFEAAKAGDTKSGLFLVMM